MKVSEPIMDFDYRDEYVAEQLTRAKVVYDRWQVMWERTETYKKRRRELNRMMAVALVIGGVIGILLARFFMSLIIL